jgi:MYXO-CTERM domain-containing protein
MRFAPAFLALAVSLSAAVVAPRDAAACGGCFVQQSENTQVTGHRMVFSVSKTESTLWDQFSYAGDPKDFAWVLPIHGQVDIGLSSDALFEALEQASAVTLRSPQITCPPPPSCGAKDAAGAAAETTTSTGTNGGVTVIAQAVVGPYETVQLSSEDPKALSTWLENHGYAIPADVEPVIAAYVKDGFDFLALKLVPGKGVASMRPVRVTTSGAGAALPLRMVAAGTGATTPATLWTFGEGRYEPKGVPTFEVALDELVWNWDTQKSNYAELVASKFAASGGKAWHVEGAEPASRYAITGQLDYLVAQQPAQSGYGDGDPGKAKEEYDADMGKLLGTLDESSLWWSRAHGELSREALAADLAIGAASEQLAVVRDFQVEKTTGTPPACPTFSPCDDSGGGTGDGGGGGWQGAWFGSGNAQPERSRGCAVGGEGATGYATALAALGLAALVGRRRRR